ncbi:chemotaxis protein CheW [Ponticaulis sp.]|uniref:chemotaxis protein CheW n=1 Tax=Ponticaulis sp. TaxID=2020902 RepID=UPI000B64EBB6|nr:chemotaxis protein CheW [Ponticaulis sp.]MAI90504.1 chemotaxis protein CheW [Ponticaulis sp.]OUY00199.1 MAG: chemotaxis protein CheW [Hyphomonadaceae bacterium TMED5]|tara:strand:+ start:132335 stop:132796 length:462 start_codon:yes stop_codon:yes gene_type:complete
MSSTEYITLWIGGQLFGASVARIHDVFAPTSITPVPLGPKEVAGLLNLRGRIVTAIDSRSRLGLPPRDKDASIMAIGIEKGAESFGLIIDEVGEVMTLQDADREDTPANLEPVWAQIASGVYRLEDRLLVVIDIDKILAFETDADSDRGSKAA